MVNILGNRAIPGTAEIGYTLETIYYRYHKNVYNYIAFRINNHHDAEELANDVFVKAIRGWQSYNETLPMEGWLIGIAKNVVTDYLRKSVRRKHVRLENALELVSDERHPDEIIIADEKSNQLMAAMAKLRDKERQILSMKFATNLKHSEIAKILHISESHVGVTAHRAITKLRKLMKEANPDER